MDSLLQEFQNDPVQIEGFADDGLLCAQGPDPGTVVSIVQNAIRKAQTGRRVGASNSTPGKQSAAFFTQGTGSIGTPP